MMKPEGNTGNKFTSDKAPKKKSGIRTGVIGVVIAFLAIGGYFLLSTNQPQNPREFTGKNESLIIGVSKSFLSIPVFIARKQGYFAYEGLDIIIKEYSSGKRALENLFTGEVDISTVAGMPVIR